MTVTSRPGAPDRRVPSPAGARVEYRLVRDAVVRRVRRGQVEAVEVCDAHPELLRAARNIGRPRGEDCPICRERQVVQVTYVFGSGLPPGGRCPGTAAELHRLCRRVEPVLCFDIEVCLACSWHHLIAKYPAGGHAPRASRSRQKSQ